MTPTWRWTNCVRSSTFPRSSRSSCRVAAPRTRGATTKSRCGRRSCSRRRLIMWRVDDEMSTTDDRERRVLNASVRTILLSTITDHVLTTEYEVLDDGTDACPRSDCGCTPTDPIPTEVGHRDRHLLRVVSLLQIRRQRRPRPDAAPAAVRPRAVALHRIAAVRPQRPGVRTTTSRGSSRIRIRRRSAAVPTPRRRRSVVGFRPAAVRFRSRPPGFRRAA